MLHRPISGRFPKEPPSLTFTCGPAAVEPYILGMGSARPAWYSVGAVDRVFGRPGNRVYGLVTSVYPTRRGGRWTVVIDLSPIPPI